MGYKTFEDMKHNIPEGATHYQNESDSEVFSFFKSVGGEGNFFCIPRGGDSDWVKLGNDDEMLDDCVKPIPPTIKTESPEEREALDMIDTTSKQVESLAKGDVVEWKNGDDCIYTGQPDLKCKFVSIHPNNNKCAIIWEGGGDINLSCVAIDCLSKPDSPEQKAERERLEAIKEMVQTPKPCGFAIYDICEQLYDAGYRKESK